MSRQDSFSWYAARGRRKSRLNGGPLALGQGFSFWRRLNVEPLEDRRMLAIITVDSPLDSFDPNTPTTDGTITLREAIVAANTDTATGDAPAGSGADAIVFDTDGVFALPQTIALLLGELEITEALSIEGPSDTVLAVDAQQNSRIFHISATTGDYLIANLTLTGGEAITGGAIRSLTSGNVTVNQSTISGNQSNGGGGGWGNLC